jgi:hypothetical protein
VSELYLFILSSLGQTLIYRTCANVAMQECGNAWDSHQWMIAQVNEQYRTVILYCNQCGFELLSQVGGSTV